MQFNGQAAQDLFVLSVLNEKRNGTFVEIGAHHPIWISNTVKLEKIYKWTGLMVEYDPSYLPLYKKERPNSTHLIQDATTVDFKSVLSQMKMPKNIDYLQIDLEVTNNSTFKTLANLEKQVMNDYKFAVVTFEHDFYCSNRFETRKKSRELFDRNGYFRVFSDVSNEGNVYEDWYVYPELVNMDYINSIKRSESLGWTEIVPLLWKSYPTYEEQIVSIGQLDNQNKTLNEKYIIINCDNHHISILGLGDRLQGFAFCIALGEILNRKVLIKWKTPDISNFFDISNYDYYNHKDTFKGKNTMVIDAIWDQTKLKQKFTSNNVFSEWEKYDILEVMCNTNPLIYLFMNEKIPSYIDYEELYQRSCRKIFSTYLKPIGDLKETVDKYDFNFKENNSTIGFQIRTGDSFFREVIPFYPIEDKCDSIVNLLEEKLNALENENQKKYNVFLTYDNPKILPYLKRITNDRITFYLDYPVGHFAIQKKEKEMLKQYADLILLSKCQALIVSHFSNFGRVPFIINDSQDKFTLAIVSKNDEFGNTEGLGKNDSSIEFKIYKPSVLDMSCKHPDWKLLRPHLPDIPSKQLLSKSQHLEIVGKYKLTIS
jgi:hypothetical protein